MCRSVLYAGQLRVRYPRRGLHGPGFLFPLLPEMSVAQLIKHLFVDVTVQCADAYPRSKGYFRAAARAAAGEYLSTMILCSM